MEGVNIQMAQLRIPAAAAQDGLRGLLGGGPALAGDPFALLLQSLLGGGALPAEDGQTPLPFGMEALPVLQEPQTGEEPQEEELNAAMQMMAQLLIDLPADPQPVLQDPGGEDPGAAAQVLQVAGAQQALGQPAQSGAQPTAAQPMAAPQLSRPQAQGQQPAQPAQPAGGDFAAVVQPHTVQTGGGGEQGAQGHTAQQDDFLGAVRQARRMLQQEKRPQADERPLDVDQLQSQVDAGRFARDVNKTAAKAALPEPAQLVEQVKKGVFSQAFSGKEEFTVKLKPEGLGEITVRMVEKEQGLTLQIITSSPQVAKMLNSELSALQNALRPYHAEVQQVVSQPQESAQSTLTGGFAGQDFSGHQHQQFGRQPQQPPFGGLDFGEEPLPESAGPAAADSGLDAYI